MYCLVLPVFELYINESMLFVIFVTLFFPLDFRYVRFMLVGK